MSKIKNKLIDFYESSDEHPNIPTELRNIIDGNDVTIKPVKPTQSVTIGKKHNIEIFNCESEDEIFKSLPEKIQKILLKKYFVEKERKYFMDINDHLIKLHNKLHKTSIISSMNNFMSKDYMENNGFSEIKGKYFAYQEIKKV